MQPADEELMDAVTRGDVSALRPLVERHHASLLGFLYRMVGGDRPLAEDLVQDTFMRLIRQRTYMANRPFKPWLYAVAANVARDHFRSASPRRLGGEPEMLTVADPAPGPEKDAVSSDTRRVVLQAVARVPHEYRATLVLRLFEDLSLNDISVALNVPVGTVKSRLSIGTRKLREELSASGLTELP